MIHTTPLKTLTCLALCFATALPASAGSAADPEVVDPAGDARASVVPLGPGSASLDIVAAWFETSDATSLHLETSGGDARPPNAVLTATFLVGDASVWVGYGRVVMPQGLVESFYGCREEGDDHDCRDLVGEARADGRGFVVEIPVEWLPAGATAREPRAEAYLLEPPVTDTDVVGKRATFDEAGPGAAYTAPGRSLGAASVGSPAAISRPVPASGALAVVAVAAALALVARRA